MNTRSTTHFLLGVIAAGVGCLTLLALGDRFRSRDEEADVEEASKSPYGGPHDLLDATGDVPYPLPVTVI